MTSRILLADDHAMMREGLRAILSKESDIEIVGEAGDGRTTFKLVKELSPDIVVMDIGMPQLNGIDATRQILASYPHVKVIALSTFSDKRYVLEMLEVGAFGYVLKEAAYGELLRAIRAACRNQKYLSTEVAGAVVDSYVSRQFPTDASAGSILGSREREVLQLLSEGKSSPQIAACLHISVNTVEAHRRNLMKKLNIHSVAELTKYAVRHGLTPL